MIPTMTAKWLSVLFVDLDHTVLRGPFCTVVFEQACGEIARKSGLRVAKVRQLVKQENLGRQRDPTVGAIEAMDWDDIVRTVAARLDIELESSIVELVQSRAKSGSRLLDKADQVLKQLKNPRRAIVAATNGLARYQNPVLEALGLYDLFDAVLTPDTYQVLKNSKSFYGTWPQNSELQINVGDDLEFDVHAPKRFGFMAIWKNGIHSYRATAEPFKVGSVLDVSDARIDSLKDLPEVVERLESQVFSNPHRTRRYFWNAPYDATMWPKRDPAPQGLAPAYTGA